MRNVARVHQLLRWANKREVARELSRRGFDVSGETLNRWVRDKREFPAVVERMVLDMYSLETQQNTPPAEADGAWVRFMERWDSEHPPPWARGLADQIISAIADERRAVVQAAVDAALDLAEQRLSGQRTDEDTPPSQDQPPAPGEGPPGPDA